MSLNINIFCQIVSSLRAAFYKQWGGMRPADRQFDMPGLDEGMGNPAMLLFSIAHLSIFWL